VCLKNFILPSRVPSTQSTLASHGGVDSGGIWGPPVSGRVFGLHVKVLAEGVARYQAIARDIPACGGSVPASHSGAMQGVIWPCHVLDQG
jgi:hypothetical protein